VRLRLSAPATRDLQGIYDYVAKDSPRSARGVIERIDAVLDLLDQHPSLGRPGRVEGTRELVVTRTNYVAIYRIDGEVIDILRVLHGRQQWPPGT
jgi:toxin ParE1/3/4